LIYINSFNSIVYCDPPYKGTKQYSGDLKQFNYDAFWNWVRILSEKNIVYVSEYLAPVDFEQIWEKTAKSSLRSNDVISGYKESTEKLFILKGLRK
jgi:DNA adenine methylase